MADTAIAITAGTGTNVDTRTESTNGNHRQVIVIGDPSENNSVLGVNASQGIKVYSEASQAVTNSGLTNLDVLLSTRLASGSTLPITNKFLDAPLSNLLASGSTLPITNSYLQNIDVLLSTRLASGSTLPITNTFLDTPLSTRLASGSTLPITNEFLPNLNVGLSTRLASGSTLPVTNAFWDIPLSTRLASGSTLPITNDFLPNLNVTLGSRLASGSTLPMTNAFLDVPLSTRLASGSTLPITGNVGLLAGTNALGKLIPPDYDVTSHTAKAVKYYTSAGAATDGIIWSPAAGKRWHVATLFINVSAAATVTLEDDLAAGDNPIMKMELAANSGVVIPFGDLYPLTSGEDAADLLITTSAGNVYVTVVGYEI